MQRTLLILAIAFLSTGALASGGGSASPPAPVPAKPGAKSPEAQIKQLKEALHKPDEKGKADAKAELKSDLKAQIKADLKASLGHEKADDKAGAKTAEKAGEKPAGKPGENDAAAKAHAPEPSLADLTPIVGRPAIRKLGPPSLASGNERSSMGAHSLAYKPGGGDHGAPATVAAKPGPFPKPESEFWGVMRALLGDNSGFVDRHGPGHFQSFLEHQNPQMTVVACSDSRVHTHALSTAPDNELFVIRNIGNQIKTAAGSVDYGVEHLNTPVLLILGHSGCGAIKAAMGDTHALHHDVRREVEQIKLDKEKDWDAAVRKNVEDQVRAALARYQKAVAAGRLTIVGAVYDLHDRQGNGHGRVQVTSVNGHRDSALIDRVRALAKVAAPRNAKKTEAGNDPAFQNTPIAPAIHYAYP